MTGGLEILWRMEEIILTNFWATKGLLSIDFQIYNTQVRGTLTNVYGPSINPQKLTFLEALSWESISMGDKNWILGGNFNLITYLE